MQQQRKDKGALELKSLDEIHFDLDDKKQPVKIEAHQDLEINEVVAEWMIFANHVSIKNEIIESIVCCYKNIFNVS